MPTDDERREVARRLRKNAEEHPDMSLLLNVAFSDKGTRPDGAMEWDVTSHDAAMRLADLIEPPERSSSAMRAEADRLSWERYDCDGTVRELRRLADEVDAACAPIDRDALLALADEMDELCGPWRDCGEHYASRIRKALGEEA